LNHYTLVPLVPALYGDWDQFVNRTPGSTFYHLSNWFDLIEDTFGYRQCGIVQLQDGQIVSGLPLFKKNRFVASGYTSSPFRDRGGILYGNAADPAQVLKKAIQISQKDNYYLHIKHMNLIDPTIFHELDTIPLRYWVTTQIDLTVGAEQLWKRLKNNAQGPVKKAIKNNIKVYPATSIHHVENFYDIFFKNRKILGIPVFPKMFFLNIWNNPFLNANTRLLLADIEGKTIAGIFLLLHKNTVIDGYAASVPVYRTLRPNDLLIWKSIEWACSNGFRVFDFGADSPSQTSLLAFKRKWNGVHKELVHYYYIPDGKALPCFDSSKMNYLIARRILANLPDKLYHGISRLVIKRLG